MGREWLYKTNGGGDGSRCGGRSPSATTTAMNRKSGKEKNTNSSSGCMSAIFNLFDNQHHHLRFRHPSFISESTITNHQKSNFCLQGVEAPRNSLESPESAIDNAPSSTKVKEQTNLNMPMVGIQIKTKRSRFPDDISSECSSSSPGTKTPNLVARLMGLDLLPEYSSPRPSASSTPANTHHRSRSLPTTPRSSTTSRRSTDNDYHHRLSLQIDKENCNRCKGQEHESLQMKMARRRSEIVVNRQDHEDRASQYAKQITNQVKERISRRRLGTDITNVISPSTRNNKEHRRDSNLVLLKPKKASTIPQAPPPSPAPETSVKAKQDETSTPFSSSKKLSFLDFKNNLNKPISNSRLSSLKEVVSKPEIALQDHRTPITKQGKPVKDEKIKRIASERYDLRLKKMNQQEDAFVNKKKKSTLLQNHVVNVKNTTKFRSFKKQMTPSSSTTKLPQKQVSLPSSLNSSYNANDTHTLNTTTTTTTAANGGSFSDHFDYISRILKQCGIHTNSPISTCQWYSPSHPLHPSIFHQLEKSNHAATAAAGTRRLIFELVNELLVEILKPHMNQKPWVYSRPPDSCVMRGSELIGKLCERIGSFPATGCEVLEDIDGLIEKDIGWSLRRQGMTAFEAEAEDIVKEIESEMVEAMVREMATPAVTVTVAPAGSDMVKSHVFFT